MERTKEMQNKNTREDRMWEAVTKEHGKLTMRESS